MAGGLMSDMAPAAGWPGDRPRVSDPFEFIDQNVN